MKQVFIDTNVPMYWAGAPSKYKDPCGTILGYIARDKLVGFASTEVLQEILYRFWHLKDMKTGLEIFDNFKTIMSGILPVCEEDMVLARKLSSKHSCSPRGLLHAAVMQNNKLKIILSADKDFDLIPSVERVDPLHFEQWMKTEPSV